MQSIRGRESQLHLLVLLQLRRFFLYVWTFLVVRVRTSATSRSQISKNETHLDVLDNLRLRSSLDHLEKSTLVTLIQFVFYSCVIVILTDSSETKENHWNCINREQSDTPHSRQECKLWLLSKAESERLRAWSSVTLRCDELINTQAETLMMCWTEGQVCGEETMKCFCLPLVVETTITQTSIMKTINCVRS